MPKKLDEDQQRRREALQKKRAARRAAKLEREREEEKEGNFGNDSSEGNSDYSAVVSVTQRSVLFDLSDDSVQLIFSFLPAADLGRLTMTCKSLNKMLSSARAFYVQSRLHRTPAIDMCSNEMEAREILQRSYGGGDTGRLVPKGKYGKETNNEFVAYARFLEEAVIGYGTLTTGNRANPILLPKFVEGRFASVSPDHSLVRAGGDGAKSGGGSGVASWGVGKRGQLGHGKPPGPGFPQDERLPRMLLGGLGYGIRVVQVSAGGGLARVAHSLLLTSTGRVLSFGTGNSGALGHGYSAGKQLPDVLRPKFVEALNSVRCICVSAGELHSAAVTSDGDVYTWGDSFCGQCGHGDKRPQVSPKQVEQGGLEDEVVASISCGSRHTLAVTEDGEVMSWGLGHFGVLGRSFTPFDYDADTAVTAFAGGGGANNNALPAMNAPIPVPALGVGVALAPGAGGGNIDAAAELAQHLEFIANISLEDSSDQCIPKIIESLQGIKIVGSSAGHRHSLLLDENGVVFSFGTSDAGCLGHGDGMPQRHPMRIRSFEDDGVRIMQISAGVDVSMAVSTTGDVYAWGKTDGGRIGIRSGSTENHVTLPRKLSLAKPGDRSAVKAVDVDCGYVHSLVVLADGTIRLCGGVGVEGENDGQEEETKDESNPTGLPRQVQNFNIWHRIPEPKVERVVNERWKKLDKYEIKGRSRNV